jgi:exonuclease III
VNIDEKKAWSWNANGLRAKKEWLEAAIDREPEAPAVILVQETHIPSERAIPHLQGFMEVHKGPSTSAGGVAIYYRTILPVSEAPPTPNLRMVAIIIDSIAIINVYAPVN